MNVVFLVQGEGRGHLTQAIALSQVLREAGHAVSGVFTGRSLSRKIPVFFEEEICAPVIYFEAPELIYRPNGKGMDMVRTITTFFSHTGRHIKSLNGIHQQIKTLQPDVIISFYELYGGLYNLLYGRKVPMLCVAHQYLLMHPDFTFPPNSGLDQFLINFNSRATSWFARKRLALSFRPIKNTSKNRISVVPPLLRKQISELNVTKGQYLLIYVTHHSLAGQIRDWHRKNPHVELQCFWDNRDAPEVVRETEHLTFHQINSEKYLIMLASCKALVTTAGFESVCEALYLGKPVMMVPVPHHFEQRCNALDGVISGAGVQHKTFDLDVLFDYLPLHKDRSALFRAWYQQGRALFLQEIEAYASIGEKPAGQRITVS